MRLGYGRAGLELHPQGEHEVVFPRELPGLGNREIYRALDNPTGPGLEDLAGAKRAAVLVSDVTRPSPSHLLVPALAERLKVLDVKDMLVVFTLGTHRLMTEAEERLLLGRAVSIPHIQHDKERCIPLGETKMATPVEIFEEVASSDAIIATGNIEYHYYAGYSGGAKAVLPGVSSESSVIANHKMMRDQRARAGSLNSPVRLDMEDAAGIAGLDCILNVVLNSRKEIVRAVAGDFVRAHREGAMVVDQMYRQKVEPADIVITCAGGAPKDINLFQATKALDHAKEAVAPGGTLILVAECPEGVGNRVFESWACEAEGPEDCLDRFGREYEFGGHKAAFIAEQALDHELVLVSSLPRETAEMCFFKAAKSLDEAVASAREKHGRDARMLVFPYGGLTLAKRRKTPDPS